MRDDPHVDKLADSLPDFGLLRLGVQLLHNIKEFDVALVYPILIDSFLNFIIFKDGIIIHIDKFYIIELTVVVKECFQFGYLIQIHFTVQFYQSSAALVYGMDNIHVA